MMIDFCIFLPKNSKYVQVYFSALPCGLPLSWELGRDNSLSEDDLTPRSQKEEPFQAPFPWWAGKGGWHPARKTDPVAFFILMISLLLACWRFEEQQTGGMRNRSLCVLLIFIGQLVCVCTLWDFMLFHSSNRLGLLCPFYIIGKLRIIKCLAKTVSTNWIKTLVFWLTILLADAT